MSASPVCTVNAASTTNGVNVASGSTVTIDLTDKSAASWTLLTIGTDEQSSAPVFTVNLVAKTATFVAPTTTAGAAIIVQSTADGASATFGVYVLVASNSLRVMALQEAYEGSAAFGWAATVNAAVRAPAGAAKPTITEVVSNVAATAQGSAAFDVTAWSGNFTASGGTCRIDVSLTAIGNVDATSGPVTFRVKVGGVLFGTPKTVDLTVTDTPRTPISFVAVGTPASAGVKAVTVHVTNGGYNSGNLVDSRDFCTITVTDYGP